MRERHIRQTTEADGIFSQIESPAAYDTDPRQSEVGDAAQSGTRRQHDIAPQQLMT